MLKLMMGMKQKVKCISCPKTWDRPDKANIIIHNRDDHQSLLIFLSDEELLRFVRAVVKETT